MQVTETQSEGLKHAYQVVVPADTLEDKMTTKLTALAQQVAVPGFRPGKAPVPLLRKTYGKRMMGEILEETVNETTSKTLEEKEIRPALQPKIEITSFEEGGDLEFTMEIEALPVVEPNDFSAIELERLQVEIGDEEVDERVSAIADGMKSFIDVAEGEAASEGDAVVIDFVGRVDGEEFEGGAAEDFQLELGSGRFIPGFEEQLVGAAVGDEKSVAVSFPDEYPQADLAGKPAEFTCTVKAVKVVLPVAIDDALAEQLGLENLEDLKTNVRRLIESEFAQHSRARLKRSLLDHLSESHDFEVPPGMIELEFNSIWKQLERELENQQKTLADLDDPEDEVRAEYQRIAERRVRLGLLLSEVGTANGLEVSQEEINQAIMQQARSMPGQETQVFQFFQQNPDAQASLRAPILEDKVCDYILELAQVTDKPVSKEELLADPEAEEDGGDDEADGGTEGDGK